jgi:O-antigen/teichoic acid export membrane protein
MASQVLGRLLAFLLLLILGNLEGPATVGLFGQLTTYLAFATIFGTFGLDLALARHCANQKPSPRTIMRVLFLRLALSALFLMLFFLFRQQDWVGQSLEGHEWSTIWILSAVLLDQIGLTTQSVLEGRKQLGRVALLVVGRWSVFALCGTAVLWLQWGFDWFCGAFWLASMVRCFLGCLFVLKELNTEALPLKTRKLVQEATPMALLNAMVSLYFQIDMIMLPELSTAEQTGLYKTAYSLVEALLFFSAAMATTTYALFSKEQLPQQIKQEVLLATLKILFSLSLPIAFCTVWIADDLIAFLFSQQVEAFQGAAGFLTLLCFALPFMFWNSNLVRYYLGDRNERAVLMAVSLTALLNITLNFILIPRMQAQGAVLATIASESALSLTLLRGVQKNGLSFQILSRTLFPFTLPALIASGLTFILTSYLPFFLVIPLVGMGYALILQMTGLLSWHDLKSWANIKEHAPC